MSTLIGMGFMLFLSLACAVAGRYLWTRSHDDPEREDFEGFRSDANFEQALRDAHEYNRATNIGGIVAGAAGAFLFLTTLVWAGVAGSHEVPEGTEGVVVTFGRYDPTELEPGFHFLLPHREIIEVDITDEVRSMNGEDAIEAEASGGGQLIIDATVRTRVTDPTDMLQKFGIEGDHWGKRGRSGSRECIREAAGGAGVEGDGAGTVEFALDGEGRRAITTAAVTCLLDQYRIETDGEEAQSFGVEILGIELGEIDPGQTVSAAIDRKVAATEDLKTAVTQRQVAGVNAEAAAIEGYGVFVREQAVACGGDPVLSGGDEGEIVGVEVNTSDDCEDPFSDGFLIWNAWETIGTTDNLVIITGDQANNLMIDPAALRDSRPTVSAAPVEPAAADAGN